MSTRFPAGLAFASSALLIGAMGVAFRCDGYFDESISLWLDEVV